jgi:hypothetical protein
MADDGLSQLTDDEKTALLALLKRTINDDRYPLSPRIGMLRGILARRSGQTAKADRPAKLPCHIVKPRSSGGCRVGARQRSPRPRCLSLVPL